jgi:2-isopropylmalate synthase
LPRFSETAPKVRVLIEWTDSSQKWTTVGVSDSVVGANWRALLDAMRLELMRIARKDGSIGGQPTSAVT